MFVGYASRQGYALDKRLFLPERWFSDAYATRRTTQGPRGPDLQSKPQLAAAMLQALTQEGLLPFKYVVADGLYGNSPDRLDAVDGCKCDDVCRASAETRCWLQRSQTEDKTYPYKGAVHAKRVGIALDNGLPCGGLARAAARPPVGIGAASRKGPRADRACICSPTRDVCKDGVPERTVWLVIKRIVGAEPILSYYISNAPASTPLRTFVWLWPTVGHRAMLCRRQNGARDGPL